MLETIVNGITNASVWQIIAYTAISCHVTLLGVTLYLHRAMAHRAVDLHPVLAHIFRFWLWMTTGMITREWVAIHRKHHARCETPDDPHSPVVLGIKKVLWQGAELYREETKNSATMDKYGLGCPNDWLERNIYDKHNSAGIALTLAIDIALFGILGIAVFAAQMLCIPVLAAGVINGLGHYWGYRNYECDDAATNVSPIGIIIAGEELHNNHHAYPSSAKFSLRPWEFDIGWAYLRVFSVLGLAKIRRIAPSPVIDRSKTALDIDSVKDLIASRLHVMEHYAKRVLSPIHERAVTLAKDDARETLRNAWTPLIRAQSLMDENALARVRAAIDLDDGLAQVYHYRDRLQSIWSLANANQEKLLHAFQEWCVEAENSGIQHLQEFAANLRGYRLQPHSALSPR